MDKQLSLEKLFRIGEIYTPAYPIEIQTLFAGRLPQIAKAISLLSQKGYQIIIYGDRGVGKTSFANILKVIIDQQRVQVSKTSCNSEHTFENLWRNVFSQFKLSYEEAKKKIGFGSEVEKTEQHILLSNLLDDRPIDISKILELLSYLGEAAIILDEFDRLDGTKFNKKLLTDAIKAISDTLPQITLIIVGVSEDISGLIYEHESIERNLAQVYLSVMSPEEIKEIILKGEEPLEVKYSTDVIEKIIDLSSGFPHFTHSLCYHACYFAISQNESSIKDIHLQVSINQTVDNAQESLRNAYRIATMATKQNIFSEVLYASSIVETDEYGYFQANDLEPILTEILGKETKVNNYVFHLGKFCIPERGEILKVVGSKNRQRYKFRNPLMKAFIRLKIENNKNLAQQASKRPGGGM